uniref:ERI1 exoribonuclease 2 n=1 Tax=Cyprinodon variegatus TaxID=28743 RepID=A0A3Q2D211_CYPVA
MSTRKLAKKLGLLRQRSQSAPGLKKSDQIFSYLIVIDFESTCWREKNNHGQEIIEFPAVLLNTSTGEVESEFHTYVQPQEHPVLSEFCTELTGITQGQVESGVPLQICLSRFNRWLQNLRMEKGVMFPNNKQTSSASSPSQKLCTFLTWSDWDLGVCLQYECKRKQLHKPDVLNSWIDLRSTYRLFYSRKPKGLNGALQDLGIQFSGREHSGLDDARNTARLAARMMRDGCVLKITRSLERVSGHLTTRWPSSTNLPAKAHQKCPSPEEPPNSSTGQTCQILIPTKTLLKVTPAPQQGQSGKAVTAQAAHGLLSTSVINLNPPRSNGSISSHVLCSTTIGCISDLPHNTTTAQVDEEDGELIVETDERCGSYDDVLLPFDDSEMDTISVDVGCISDFDSRCQDLEGMDRSSVGPLSLQPENLKMPNDSRHLSMMSSTAKGPKLTAPLCACGRRARRQVVSNGGPNHGRGFYCCPVRRSAGRGSTGKGCGFFKWESALIKSSMLKSHSSNSVHIYI